MNFDQRSARRVVDAVRQFERNPRSPTPLPRGATIATPCRVILVTSKINPGSGPTPGKGAGKLQLFDGTRFNDLTPDLYDVFNLTEATIKVGAYVQVVVIDGHFFYDVTACSNGS